MKKQLFDLKDLAFGLLSGIFAGGEPVTYKFSVTSLLTGNVIIEGTYKPDSEWLDLAVKTLLKRLEKMELFTKKYQIKFDLLTTEESSDGQWQEVK